MVTKARKVPKPQILRFKKEWLIDPGPDGYKDLTRQAVRDIAQAKKEFTARVNEIFKTGRR